METHKRMRETIAKRQLQLGHGDLPVETPGPSLCRHRHCRASIGPRRFTRGNLGGTLADMAPVALASIGPRRFTRGNLEYFNEIVFVIGSFNWATEIYPWKRVQMRKKPGTCWSFNWATEIYPWKRVQMRKKPGTCWSFNWATEIYPWKRVK